MEAYKTEVFIALFIILSTWIHLRVSRKKRQLKFIQNYKIPKPIIDRFKEKYPKLSSEDANLTSKALMDYFYICNMANGKMVSMPSRVVDDLWHEFLLFSKSYESFCNKAFGKLLHHVPEEAMPSKNSNNKGMKRAWNLICVKEDIHPKYPNKMPLLFAIDSILEIENGLKYSLNKMNSYSNNGAGCGGSGAGCGGFYVGDYADSSSGFGDSGGANCGGASCGGGGCGGA